MRRPILAEARHIDNGFVGNEFNRLRKISYKRLSYLLLDWAAGVFIG